MSVSLDRLLQKQRLADLDLAAQLAENDRDVAFANQLAKALPALASVGVETVDHVQRRTREDALERAMAELASSPDVLGEKNALTGVADGPVFNRPGPTGVGMDQVIEKRKIANEKATGAGPKPSLALRPAVDVARALAGSVAAPAPAAPLPESRVEEIIKTPATADDVIVKAPAPKGLAADLAGISGNVQPPAPHFQLQGELPAFTLPERKPPALVPPLERPALPVPASVAPAAPDVAPPGTDFLKALQQQYGSGKKGPVGPGGVGGSDPFAILPDENAKQWRQRLRNLGKTDAEINALVPKYWGMGEKLEFESGEEAPSGDAGAKKPEGSVGGAKLDLAMMLAGSTPGDPPLEASAAPMLGEARYRQAPPVAPQDASRAEPVAPAAPAKPKPTSGMGNGSPLPPVMPAPPSPAAPREIQPPMFGEPPSLSPGKLQLDPLLMALARGERPLPLPEEVKANPVLYKAPPKPPAPEVPSQGAPANPLDRGLPRGIGDVDVAKLLAGAGSQPNYRSSMNELVDGAMHRAGLDSLSDYERNQIRAKLVMEATKLRKEHEKSAGTDLDKLKKLAEIVDIESKVGAREVAELEKQTKGYAARAEYEKQAIADRIGASDVLAVLREAAEPDETGVLQVNPDRLAAASQKIASDVVSGITGNRLIDTNVIAKLLENETHSLFTDEREFGFDLAVQTWRENSANLDRTLKQSIAGMRVGGRGKRRPVPPSTVDSLSAAREELNTSIEMVGFFEANRGNIMKDMSGNRSALKVFFDEVGRELPSIGVVLPSSEGGFGAGGQIDLGKLSTSISKALSLVNNPETKRFLGLYGQKVFASANRLNGGRMTDADYAILSGFISPNSSDPRVFIPAINDIVTRERRTYENRYESLGDLYDVSPSLLAPSSQQTLRTYEQVEKPAEEAAADLARRQARPLPERLADVKAKMSADDLKAYSDAYNRGLMEDARKILMKYEQ